MMFKFYNFCHQFALISVVYIFNFKRSTITIQPMMIINVFELTDVMPPDEEHQQVNNSVYTNTVAKLSLELPEFIDGILGQQSKALYKEVADRLYIPFNETGQYHPEYDGYPLGTVRFPPCNLILLVDHTF